MNESGYRQSGALFSIRFVLGRAQAHTQGSVSNQPGNAEVESIDREQPYTQREEPRYAQGWRHEGTVAKYQRGEPSIQARNDALMALLTKL